MENTAVTPRNFTLSENLVSATLNYLSQRPHAEVNQLVMALSQSIQAQLTPEEIALIQARQNGTPATTPATAPAAVEATPTKKAAKKESKS